MLPVSILLKKKSPIVHLSMTASSSLWIPHQGLGLAFIRWISNLACRQIQWNKQSSPTGYISKQYMTNKPVKAVHNLSSSKDTVAFDNSYWEIMNYMSILQNWIQKCLSGGRFYLEGWCPSQSVLLCDAISDGPGISVVFKTCKYNITIKTSS